ncbi:hypothetical protein GXB85_01175 [Cellulomonas sp. APG4]|uniref:hypothetical protein n=1 Tax=Cellulomonas sp. APG4 TaxID=1538656 RepID=UPI0013796ED7|nr:hypothetical protein [Cellulomonas sp. APG4]NCT89569.1 hypothetical protein [Cellulomonas sp. APG4]
MLHARRRLTAATLGAVLALGLTTLATPASAASAAATAFSNCMAPYTAGMQKAYKAPGIKSRDNIAQAIHETGFTRCYYALSQRTDITANQEISALQNYRTHHALASKYIIRAGVDYYNEIMRKFALKGLTLR